MNTEGGMWAAEAHQGHGLCLGKEQTEFERAELSQSFSRGSTITSGVCQKHQYQHCPWAYSKSCALYQDVLFINLSAWTITGFLSWLLHIIVLVFLSPWEYWRIFPLKNDFFFLSYGEKGLFFPATHTHYGIVKSEQFSNLFLFSSLASFLFGGMWSKEATVICAGTFCFRILKALLIRCLSGYL